MNSAVRTRAIRTRHSARQARAKILTHFRRESILAAARTVFAKHGFATTTVDLIAEEAGVAKGTVYLYYSSKTALYSEAVVAGMRELAHQTVVSLSADIPLQDKLRNLLEMRMRYFEERADFFRIYNAELGSLGQAAVQIRQEYRRSLNVQVERLEKELRAAIRKRTVRKHNSRQVALAVLDLSHGIVQRRLDNDARDRREDIDELLNVLWRGIAT